jgi:hypothetical protein
VSPTDTSTNTSTDNSTEATAIEGDRRRLAEKSPCEKDVCPFPDALLITEFYLTEKRCKKPSYVAAVSQAMAMSSYIEFGATAVIVVLLLRCGYMTTKKPMALGDHFSIVSENEDSEMKDYILKDLDPKIEKLQDRLSKLETDKGSGNPESPGGNAVPVEAASTDSLAAGLKRVQESTQALSARYSAMDAKLEQQATVLQYERARSEMLAFELKGVTTPAEPTSPGSAQGAALRLSASATADSPDEGPPVPKARAYAPA